MSGCPTALAFLGRPRFRDVELNVDLKHLGCEPVLLDRLPRPGLLDRTLISCQVASVIDRVRVLEPRARVGISVGGRLARMSRHWSDWRAQVLAGLAERRWDALMAQHRLVDGRLLQEVFAREAELYAWTVNQRSAIDRLRRLASTGSPPRIRAFSPKSGALHDRAVARLPIG